MLDVVRRTAEMVFMPLTVGGGIRTLDDIRSLLRARQRQGVDQFGRLPQPGFRPPGRTAFWQPVYCGATRPQTGAEDGREVWEVHIHGGRIGTGLEAVAWARQVEELGAGEIVLTSMDADGTQNGYDLEITRTVSEAVSVPVVASGGAGCPNHMADAILLGGAEAALAAGIFHFGQFTIRETKEVMRQRGIPGATVEDLRPSNNTFRRIVWSKRGNAMSPLIISACRCIVPMTSDEHSSPGSTHPFSWRGCRSQGISFFRGIHMPTAVLVDGGFFLFRYRRLRGRATPAKAARDLHWMCRQHLQKDGERRRLYRIFFYDCPPLSRRFTTRCRDARSIFQDGYGSMAFGIPR